MSNNIKNIMALDVGAKRTGIATGNTFVRLPNPLTTVETTTALEKIAQLINTEKIDEIVVGWPRNLNGQETEQTRFTENFINQLKVKVLVPVSKIDEAATSLKAEAELKSRGKPYNKEDVDSLAAAFILEDYLNLEKHDV